MLRKIIREQYESTEQGYKINLKRTKRKFLELKNVI